MDNAVFVKVKYISGDVKRYNCYGSLDTAYSMVDCNKPSPVVMWVGVEVDGMVVACYKGRGEEW